MTPARFCPSCGGANGLAVEFCEQCGAPLTLPPAAPVPPAPPAPPEPPAESKDEPLPPRSNRPRRDLTAVAITAGIVAALLLTVAIPMLVPTTGPSSSTISRYSESVARVANDTVDPGPSAASVAPFFVPLGALSANLSGNLSAEPCLPLIRACLLLVAIVTPTNWSSYLAGGPLDPVWCLGSPGTCATSASTTFQSTNLSSYAGATLDLVILDLGVLPAVGAWDAELHYAVRG